jgi:hypothetical protein
MLLRYERSRDVGSRQLSGLEVVGYRYGPWKEYGGEEGNTYAQIEGGRG